MNQYGLSISAEAEIILNPKKELAKIVETSLQPEVDNPVSNRSKVKIIAENGIIKIKITASDLSALRAALNSYLRWINSIMDVLERVS